MTVPDILQSPMASPSFVRWGSTMARLAAACRLRCRSSMARSRLLSIAEDGKGSLKFVVAEGESVPGPILEIGNTNSRYRFPIGARRFHPGMEQAGPCTPLRDRGRTPARPTGEDCASRRYRMCAGLLIFLQAELKEGHLLDKKTSPLLTFPSKIYFSDETSGMFA